MSGKRRLSVKGIIVICLLCLILGVAGGIKISNFFHTHFYSQSNVYSEIAELLQQQYLDTVESDLSVEQRMLKGLAAGLGDPYTVYMEQSEADDLTSTINGSFVGIGVSYTKIEKGGIVKQVFKDSPADKAGMKAGDVITHINGNEIKSYTSEKIKESIVGKPGTQVMLRVLRQGEYHDVTITRNKVESSLEGGIKTIDGVLHGYILLTTFGDSTASLLEEKLKIFKEAGVENIIIDLRGNSGGYLTSVQSILDLFIDAGETLLSIEYKNEEKKDILSTQREKYKFKNGIVLINESSASSSEVMAAAMQELLEYKLVGTTTFGKGIVQTQVVLSDSSTLKYTHAKWLTPSGKCIHNIGVKPDVEVHYYNSDDVLLFNIDKDYQYDQVSEYVAAMQSMLKHLGYDVEREDGYFSKQTKEQLQLFEKTYHLESDGVLSQDDLTVMFSNLIYKLTYQSEDAIYNEAIALLK